MNWASECLPDVGLVLNPQVSFDQQHSPTDVAVHRTATSGCNLRQENAALEESRDQATARNPIPAAMAAMPMFFPSPAAYFRRATYPGIGRV